MLQVIDEEGPEDCFVGKHLTEKLPDSPLLISLVPATLAILIWSLLHGSVTAA